MHGGAGNMRRGRVSCVVHIIRIYCGIDGDKDKYQHSHTRVAV